MPLHLEYKASVAEDKTAPVVFFVHGRAGTKEVMWTFTRALPEQVTVIAPQAPRPDPIGGYSWWEVLAYDDITNEMIDEGVASLERFIENALTELQLSPKIILAYGFSQGSGALSLLMQRRPNLFHGLAILAGFVIKDWRGPPSRLPPVLIAHGTKDTLVPLSRAEDGREYLTRHGADVMYVTDDVGHKVGSEGMRILKQWTSNLIGLSQG